MEKKQWIITKTNSETPEVVFYKFVGTVNELKCKLLHMAQECSVTVEFLNIDCVEFNEGDQTAIIDVTSRDGGYVIFTTQALASIEFTMLEEK